VLAAQEASVGGQGGRVHGLQHTVPRLVHNLCRRLVRRTQHTCKPTNVTTLPVHIATLHACWQLFPIRGSSCVPCPRRVNLTAAPNHPPHCMLGQVPRPTLTHPRT
jgi:hypothetical protein